MAVSRMNAPATTPPARATQKYEASSPVSAWSTQVLEAAKTRNERATSA
jgi:hypothetical protein